ncbi:hypothetical protein QR680_002533 [Steinernema hermaphroditum]|uniref:Uncharacterized protein n=1 Tax=Steinernema hermaphroditum TaxID=289476 RepID=A0AA39H4U6_9BILA|nr:hypothetical protein QR680_002533 [Steinernema hermaphroditum]
MKQHRQQMRPMGDGAAPEDRPVWWSVQLNVGISKTAMCIICAFVYGELERFAYEAVVLAKYTRRRSIISREIQSAARLVLPADLGGIAMADGHTVDPPEPHQIGYALSQTPTVLFRAIVL